MYSVSIGCFDCIARKPLLGVIDFFLEDEYGILGGVDFYPSESGNTLPPVTSPGLGAPIVAIDCGPPEDIDGNIERFRDFKKQFGWEHRDYGCATYSLREVLEGQSDGYYSAQQYSWRIMGMAAIIEAAGGACDVDWKTVDLTKPFPFACGTKEFIAAVRSKRAQAAGQ